MGNVILKLYEGTAKMLLSKVKTTLMSSLKTKIGALLIKNSLSDTMKSFDAKQYGGAPLIGLNGLVVKTHGNAKAMEVKNSLLQCVKFQREKVNEKLLLPFRQKNWTKQKRDDEYENAVTCSACSRCLIQISGY